MRLGPLPLLLVLGAACAHAPAEQARHADEPPLDEALFTIRYQPEDAAVARQLRRILPEAARAAQRWGELSSPVAITIHPTHEALESAVQREGLAWLRAWARRGAVDLQSPRTWTRGEASDAELAQLFTHELTHCVMYQAMGREARLARGVPVWFREGMASTTAEEPQPRSRRAALWTLYSQAIGAPRPGGDPLTDAALLYRTDSPLVYATADRAFRFLVGRCGEARIRLLLSRVREGHDFAKAFHDVVGVPVSAFEAEFRSVVVREGIPG